MVNFQQSPNPVIDAIEVVFKMLENSGMKPEALEGVKPELDQLSAFFKCNEQQAALLAVLFGLHFENTETSVGEMVDHLDLRRSAAVYIHQLLRPFTEKKWFRPKQDTRIHPLTSYVLNNRILLVISANNWKAIEEKPVTDSLQLLNRFNQKVRDRRDRLLSFDELVKETDAMVKKWADIDLPSFILDIRLDPVETTYFMYMCTRHFLGDDDFGIESLLSDLSPAPEDQYRFRIMMQAGEGTLFEQGLVEWIRSEGPFASRELQLTQYAISAFIEPIGTKIRKPRAERLALINPVSIREQSLFYNKEEEGLVKRVSNLLAEDQYVSFVGRMEEKGMIPGITILLHGGPGTGKTETVMQWAKLSGRSVMMADASQLRSKWVGDSEKNLRQLFNDYRDACEKEARIPVLLFNEADSFLGKRRAVNSGVDQMENTMQNILLEELEKFDGIFVATTNLTGNFDSALDRRFLFKVQLNVPDKETRHQILLSRFPELQTEALMHFAEKWQLTGGQLYNIRKKMEIDSLLDTGLVVNSTYLDKLATEELSIERGNRSGRNKVGFTI